MSLQKNNKNNKNSYRIKRFLHSYLNPEPALFIQITDLVDDAAGEEGGRFLTVCMETERHQSVGPHREVVVHGQNLRRKSSVCFIVQLSVTKDIGVHQSAQREKTHLWFTKVDAF